MSNNNRVVSLNLRTFSVIAVVIAAAVGCKNETNDATASEDEVKQPPAPEPSARIEGDVHRNFLDEVGRAELRAGGLVINMGTSDQHKYTRGGWKTGWSVSKKDKAGPSEATTSWSKASLDVLLDRAPAELVVRARSLAGGHSIRPYLGDTSLGKASLSSKFEIHRFAVPPEVGSGAQTLAFRFSKSGSAHTAIDWIHLADEAGAELGPMEPVALPVSINDVPKRALVAPGSRSYSFYVQPAEGERLIADYGSEVGATFEIRAHVDGAEPEILWSKKAGAGWDEVAVDLDGLAGKAVRLELAVSAKPGVSGWGEPVLMRPERAEPGRDLGVPAKNIVYILIDTARADAFDPGADIKTPAYDALAAKSARFSRAYNNENWTKPSVATVLSGVYPSTHKTKQDDSAVPKKLELISQRLQREGFATAGFVANGYVSNKFGFKKGWDHFTNYIREGKSSEADKVYADALGWLEKQRETHPDKRTFLYLQTIDPHVNYSVPEEYWKPYLPGGKQSSLSGSISAADQNKLSAKKGDVAPGDMAWVRALYAGEITYHDEYMGKFFEAARGQGLLADTAIIISNDHGEETGERNRYGHGHSLYEEMIRSPLLVHYPPLIADAAVIDDIVEHVDVVPTMLDLLGLEPSQQAEGESLLPLISGEPVPRPRYAVTEFLDGRRSVVIGNYKLMRSSGNWIKVFDLATDPAETKDLSATAPIARRLCETYLGEGLAVPTKARRQQDLVARQRFEAGKAEISDELRRKFEALGYFGAKPKPADD
jgi:arylsulfatase A-like enzyme